MLIHPPGKTPRILLALSLALMALVMMTLWGASRAAPPLVPHPEEPVTAEAVGHFGGWLAAVAAPPGDSKYVYLGEGSGFTVHDVSDKSQPRQVGGLSLDSTDVNNIVISGTVAYVTNGKGLRVVDISDPTNPTLLGSFDPKGTARAVSVSGSYAYVVSAIDGNDGWLQVVDVSDPTNPREVGSYDTPGTARGVDVSGNYAYVADGGSGLQIVDVSNPASPASAGSFAPPGYASDVQVVGNTAYMANGLLAIVDVSDPANPSLLGVSYDTGPRNLQVVGTTVYAADGSDGLRILDASDPANPTVVGTSDLGWAANSVAVSGSYAYVGDAEKGLGIVDVGSPASPSLLGAYERPPDVHDVFVPESTAPNYSSSTVDENSGPYGYVAGIKKLWVVDLTNPAIPRPVGTGDLQDQNWGSKRLYVSDTLAYVAEEFYGVEIFDVSNPVSPTLVGQYPAPGSEAANDVFVVRQYAYVTTRNGSDGYLRVVDVSNPASPTEVGSYDTSGDARRVVVAGNIAYVADGAAGLRLINVSNPASPVELGNVTLPTGAATTDMVHIVGDRAYVGSNKGDWLNAEWWLQEIDVSTPSSPTVLNTYHATGHLNDLDVYGDHVYLAASGGSLHIFYRFGLIPVGVYHMPYAYSAHVFYNVFTHTLYVFVDVHSLGWWTIIIHLPSEPTRTPTKTRTATRTSTVTLTPTSTATETATPTNTPTETIMGTPTSTGTVTPTPSKTSTPSITPTPSPTVTPFGLVCCEITLGQGGGCGMTTFDGCLRAGGVPFQGAFCAPAEPLWRCQTPVTSVTATATGSPTVTPTGSVTGSPTPTGSPTATGSPTPTGSVTTTPTTTPTVSPPEVELKSEYERYFLKDVSWRNCYRAIPKWNGPPGHVDITKNELGHRRLEEEPYQICYDMGSDWRADKFGGRNLLQAVAVNGYGLSSEPAILHPMVFPLPHWARLLLEGPWGVFPLGKFVLYSMEIRYPSPAFKADWTLPSWVPFAGGKPLGIKSTQARVGIKAKSNGAGSGKLYGQTGFVAFGRSVVGIASGKGVVQIRPGEGLDMTRAEFSLGIKGSFKTGKIGVADLFPALRAAENWWFVGWVIRKFNGLVSVQGMAEPQLYSTFVYKDVNDDLQFERGEGTGAVKLEITLAMELWEKLKAALYGGAIPQITLQVPASPSYLKKIGARFFYGLKLIIWKWESRFERGINCFYPGGCTGGLAQAAALSQANWQLMSRAYVTEDYAAFTANRSASRLRGQLLRPQTTEETEIVHGVFPLAEPDMDMRDNGQQMLTWVHDDPAKPNGQGEEIYFTFWNGTNWTAAAGITNDNNEDFAPQVAFDGSGHAVAVWERSNLVHPITSTLDITFTQSMEIAYSEWDGASWSAPALLTSNNAMDYGPELARAQDGKVMAVWHSNSGETLIGDDNNPDSLYYAIWDGAAWSTPATAAANVTGTLGSSLAYHGPQAAIVLSRDTDGDLTTAEDGELFYSEWNGTSWSALTQLTDDEVADSAPQVVYDGAGQANVVWLKGDELFYLAGGWAGTPAPLWPEGSVIFANYELTKDPSDNLVLVYQAISEDGADIHYTVYDEANGLWGLANRLTQDLPLEDYLTPVFASEGTLWIAYTKVETLFEDKEVEVEGETITVEDVPVPGRSDLYLLRHTLDHDLAISAEDIAFSVPNPAPGQTVVISATVHNTGDLAVAGGKVKIYDAFVGPGGTQNINGFSGARTSQIGDVLLLDSPLRAGMTDTVSVEWEVPDLPISHDIYVIVDPLIEVFESDEGNNVAYVTTVLPDLLVGGWYVEYVPTHTIQITTTVANSGTVPAPGVKIEWHRDAITGTLLDTATLGTIPAGGSAEDGFTWDVSATDAGSYLVYAVIDADEAITESDEENNSDMAAAGVLPDFNLDGSYLKMAYDAELPEEPVPVNVTLRNEGVADAQNVRVRFVQGDPFTNTSPVLYETVVLSLAAGGEAFLPASISVTGWGDVYAIADPDWEIEEVYKGDNLALLVDFPLRIYLPLLQR